MSEPNEQEDTSQHLKRVTTRIKGTLKKKFNDEVKRSGDPESVVLRKVLRSYYKLDQVKGEPLQGDVV